ncbi:MAG: hypothetical protein ACSLFK_14425, partial [Gemmatimonadaceae bacterium]
MLAATLDFDSGWGRGALSVAIAVVVLVVAWGLGRGASRAFEDPQQSYNVRRLVRAAAWLVV